MRLRRSFPLLLLSLLACDSATAPVHMNGVDARVRNGEIEIVNHTPDSVFTAVVVPYHGNVAVDYIFGQDPAICPPLAPGATRREPWPHTFDGMVALEAQVIWWGGGPYRGGGPSGYGTIRRW